MTLAPHTSHPHTRDLSDSVCASPPSPSVPWSVCVSLTKTGSGRVKSLCRNPGVYTLARVGADGFVTKLPPADVLTGFKILPYKRRPTRQRATVNGPERHAHRALHLECRGAPVVRRGDARVAPPCPTTSCVWRSSPYLTLPENGHRTRTDVRCRPFFSLSGVAAVCCRVGTAIPDCVISNKCCLGGRHVRHRTYRFLQYRTGYFSDRHASRDRPRTLSLFYV